MSSITTSAIDTPSRRSLERTCDDLAILVLAAVALIAGALLMLRSRRKK